jgi:hypothetical protein
VRYLTALRIMVSTVWNYQAGKISEEELRAGINDARALTGREPLP